MDITGLTPFYLKMESLMISIRLISSISKKGEMPSERKKCYQGILWQSSISFLTIEEKIGFNTIVETGSQQTMKGLVWMR